MIEALLDLERRLAVCGSTPDAIERAVREWEALAVSVRLYRDVLTADVNDKGVLDIDTVKGCTAGMAARDGGCYGACYAATIAKFRGSAA